MGFFYQGNVFVLAWCRDWKQETLIKNILIWLKTDKNFLSSTSNQTKGESLSRSGKCLHQIFVWVMKKCRKQRREWIVNSKNKHFKTVLNQKAVTILSIPMLLLSVLFLSMSHCTQDAKLLHFSCYEWGNYNSTTIYAENIPWHLHIHYYKKMK